MRPVALMLSAVVVLTMNRPSKVASPTDKQLKALYDSHGCFDLRSAEEKGEIPAFYRTVVACSFRDQKPCDEGLAKIVRDAPDSDDAYEGISLSASYALADGRYRSALANFELMLRMRPADEDAQNARAMLAALTAFADQQTIRYEKSTVVVEQFDGNVGAVVSINGKAAAYIFDDSFPNLVASQGHKDVYTQHGVGSSESIDSVVLPSLDFRLADFPVKLSPARILLQHTAAGNSSYFFGNLGMDLLNQSHDLTIDFQAMRLSLH